MSRETSGDLQNYIANSIKIINAYLEEHLPNPDARPQVIHQAMRYSVFAGGKRLRPMLVMASCEAVGGQVDQALPTAAAMELIHTYSLVHDDLPAMDNDDYRRGQLTNHKVFGEAIAILSGDALLTYAFRLLANNGYLDIPAKSVCQIIAEISEAAGSLGMIGGQVVDIESENKAIDVATLEYIHAHKTGALFKAAVRSGAIIGGATEQELEALTDYAHYLGLAFQITDDILDVEGDQALLGKPVGSDEKNQKATYPAIYGMPRAKEMAQEAVDQALTSLTLLGSRGEILAQLVTQLTTRTS